MGRRSTRQNRCLARPTGGRGQYRFRPRFFSSASIGIASFPSGNASEKVPRRPAVSDRRTTYLSPSSARFGATVELLEACQRRRRGATLFKAEFSPPYRQRGVIQAPGQIERMRLESAVADGDGRHGVERRQGFDLVGIPTVAVAPTVGGDGPAPDILEQDRSSSVRAYRIADDWRDGNPDSASTAS